MLEELRVYAPRDKTSLLQNPQGLFLCTEGIKTDSHCLGVSSTQISLVDIKFWQSLSFKKTLWTSVRIQQIYRKIMAPWPCISQLPSYLKKEIIYVI